MHDPIAELLAQDPPADLPPRVIVGRLFEVLQAAAGTRCAFAYETVQVGRRLYFAEVQASGPPDFRRAAAALEGQSVFRYVCPVDAPEEEVWPGELNPVGRFGTTGRRAVAGLGARSMLWQVAGIRSTLGMTVMHDDMLVGGIALVRLNGEPGFGRVDINAARALEADTVRWFSAAWRRRIADSRPPGSRSYIVFDRAGRLRSVSRGASRWLADEAVRARLGELAASFARGASRPEAFVRRAPVRFEPLDGEGGSVLAIVEEAAAHRPGPREKLTDAQRRVADLAVAGATVKEIAAGLKRSPETVRDHLKAIYERLGIGSRVELGRVLDPPPPEPVATLAEGLRSR